MTAMARSPRRLIVCRAYPALIIKVIRLAQPIYPRPLALDLLKIGGPVRLDVVEGNNIVSQLQKPVLVEPQRAVLEARDSLLDKFVRNRHPTNVRGRVRNDVGLQRREL